MGERGEMPSKEFVPMVRYAGQVIVFFRDKHTVIVKQGSTMVVFHRWWERHDFDYSSSWKPFCQALRCNAGLTLARCCCLADKYEVSMQSYSGGLTIPPGIKVIGSSRKDAGRW